MGQSSSVSRVPLDLTFQSTQGNVMTTGTRWKVRAITRMDMMWAHWKFDTDSHYILAWERDVLVGYISLLDTKQIRRLSPQTDVEFVERGGVLGAKVGLTVNMLYVSKAYRGRGVMTALIKQVVEYASTHAYAYFTFMTSEHNIAIQDTARKMGITQVGAIQFKSGNAYVYRRDIVAVL